MMAPNMRSGRRQRQTVYWWRRLFVLLGLMAVVSMLFIGWRGFSFWNRPLNQGVAQAQVPDTSRFTVLIVGSDDRPDSPGRSDSMMLGFVDLDKGSVQLLSLPRDSYVDIPGHGWDKVNAAYAFGKTELTRQTVENLIGIPVDYSVTVNMQGFEKIVDAVGGVDINVDENMDYDDPYDDPPLHIHLKAGEQHMDGVDALHYVRFRHDAQSDWGRMKRQQTFLKALLHAAKQPANITKIPQLLKLVMDTVQTNLSPSQMTRIALAAKEKLSDQSLTGATLTGDDVWSPEGYYLALHFQEMRNTVHQLAGVTSDDQVKAKDAKDAAAYAAELAKDQVTPVETPAPKEAEKPASDAGAKADDAVGKTEKPATPAPSQPAAPPADGSADAGSGSGDKAAAPATTAWPLVVVDGSGGKKADFILGLKTQGFSVIALQHAQGVEQTTIVWYNGSPDAANKLKALLPQAKFLHLSPGPGDPPLKLILGSK